MARVTRRTTTRPVSARTAARRARQRQEAAVSESTRERRSDGPETLGQARVWTRKQKRYEIAGLCSFCASQAAWGHAEGFQKIQEPCSRCKPLVDAFPTPGPRKSPWRKILDKLEYYGPEQLGEWLDKWSPDISVPAQCGHPYCEGTGYRKVA